MLRNGSPQPANVQQFKESLGALQGTLRTLDQTVSVLEETLKQKKAALRASRVQITQDSGFASVTDCIACPNETVFEDDRYSLRWNTHEKVGVKPRDAGRPLTTTGQIRRLALLDECCDMALSLIREIQSHIDTECIEKPTEYQAGSDSYRQTVHTIKQNQLARILNIKLERLERLVMQHARQRQEMLARLPREEKQLLLGTSHLSEVSNEGEAAAAKSHGRKMLLLQLNYSTMLKQLDLYHIELGKSWQRLSKHMSALTLSDPYASYPHV